MVHPLICLQIVPEQTTRMTIQCLHYLLKQTVCLCHTLAFTVARQYLANAFLKIHVTQHAQLPHALTLLLELGRVRRVVVAELFRIHAD